MKQFFAAAAACALAALAPCAAQTNWHLALEPLFGLKIGQIDEYVFLKESNYSDDTLSELNWELKPELYAGLKVQGGWKHIFGELSLSAGIPMRTGCMKDYDWLNNQSGIAASQSDNWLTCYSEHDNYLERDFSFGVKGGYEFAPWHFLSITPALAFDYNSIKFSGEDGEGWYGYGAVSDFYREHGYYAAYNDAENQYHWEFDGQVIAYSRESYYLWLGADAVFTLPWHISVCAGLFLAPYVYAVSYDSHLTTKTDFADVTDGAFAAVKGNLGVAYQFDRHSSVRCGAEYFYQKTLRGDDYSKAAGADRYKLSTDADGGAGARFWTFSLSYRLTFF